MFDFAQIRALLRLQWRTVVNTFRDHAERRGLWLSIVLSVAWYGLWAGVAVACAAVPGLIGAEDIESALPGLLLSGFGQMMQNSLDPKTVQAGTAVGAVGTLMFVVGLGFYARMKGRSGLNALWGLLSCIGLLVLAFLNKHCHNCKRSSSFRTKQCPQCGAPM